MQSTAIFKCSQNNAFHIRHIILHTNKTAGSFHLFKITGILMPEKVKLNKHYNWDILEVDWKEVKVTFNEKAINLPKSIAIKF